MTSTVTLLVTTVATAVMTVVSFLPFSQATECKHHFSWHDSGQGVFTSPGYPEEYPVQYSCLYSFDAAGRGVRIQFEHFNLEDLSETEHQCVFDYIDVYAVDAQGYRTVLGRYCGNTIPDPITTPHSSLIIEFVSDYTKPSTGFVGRYTFLGHSPTEHNSIMCGQRKLEGSGGTLHSPNYPRPFHGRVNCSWQIHVQQGEQVMLSLEDLDIGNSPECKDSGASLQYHYDSDSRHSVPQEKLCGQLHSVISARKKETVSPNNTVVVRFVSGHNNSGQSKGFKLTWTAVRLPEHGPCHQFQCEGGFDCGSEGLRGICIPLPPYCIHNDLRCNGVPNCGQYDDSDERRCPREILIMTALIAVPSLAVVMLIVAVAVVYCWRTKHLNKSASQNQPLTIHKHSSSSKESFHSHRSYQQCSMMQTSFVDGGGENGTMGGASADPGSGPGGGGGSSSGGGGGSGSIGVGTGASEILPVMEEAPTDIDDQQLQIPIPPPPYPNYRTHQKRASYTIIKDNFDDNGTVLSDM